MDTKLLIESLMDYGNTLKGAEVYYRHDWECFYFSLLGKCFGLMSNALITLKNTIDKNTALRTNYPFIKPGYHMNKAHWISIDLHTNRLSINELLTLIKESYQLVYKGLSVKDKLIIDEMPERL